METLQSGVCPQPRVLLVDDEESIRQTLSGIFRDEGFEVRCAENGISALSLLHEYKPSLVLLDIWMPEMDGIETLKHIKEICPDLPVVMISGHATISTAMAATRMGAVDFIEKPLDLHTTLDVARRAMASSRPCGEDTRSEDSESPAMAALEGDFDISRLNRLALAAQPMKGRAIQQKTISRSAIFYGKGLHSGTKSGLILEPLPAGSGIHFMGVSGRDAVPAHVDFVEGTGYATSLRFGDAHVATVEHLMSALHAYQISNLLVKCNGEVPVMDGSAQEFCAMFEETGLEEQDGEWYEIAVDKTYRVEKGGEFVQVEPADHLVIDYTLDYPAPVGRQHFLFEMQDVDSYRTQIAGARTFGFAKDVTMLHRAGLAQGGRFDNFVLIGAEGAVNTELRYPDELVRHKILDIMGDLYLLGRPIRGKITASMTGHSDNYALLKQLQICMRDSIC